MNSLTDTQPSVPSGTVTAHPDPLEAFLREVSDWPELTALAEAMLDYAVEPMDLWLCDPLRSQEPYHPRTVVQAYNALVGRTRTWEASLGSYEREGLDSHLPLNVSQEIAKRLVEVVTTTRYYELPDSLFHPPPSTSRVFAAIPSLVSKLDEDGLLDVDGLDAHPQAIFSDGHALHYHQLLRRCFTSGINASLIDVLLSTTRRLGLHLRLAIDERRLMPASEYTDALEKEYWWGPLLTWERLDDPNAVGTTVHRARPDVRQAIEHEGIQVYWSLQDGRQKVVQIEELRRTEDVTAEGYVLCRYLHAIRDIQAKRFIHCDGAVRAYSQAEYIGRLAESLPKTRRAARYRKVFRIDGAFEAQDWSDITALWFRHNDFIREYLSASH